MSAPPINPLLKELVLAAATPNLMRLREVNNNLAGIFSYSLNWLLQGPALFFNIDLPLNSYSVAKVNGLDLLYFHLQVLLCNSSKKVPLVHNVAKDYVAQKLLCRGRNVGISLCGRYKTWCLEQALVGAQVLQRAVSPCISRGFGYMPLALLLIISFILLFWDPWGHVKVVSLCEV
ncbi:hypothetical protein IFM89_028780 [Coptis chinensis]|uniref:Uncharacterized protein n=1 Tax=Coptis chinensis TaxID=261450 RepID=A0A835H0E9_9MAGN|nr:hypothetical protein IFM89_028780 [Coptis chinensis]